MASDADRLSQGPSRQELEAQLRDVQAQLAAAPHAFNLLAQRGVLQGMLNRWVAAYADLDRALRIAPRAHPLKAVIYRMRGMAHRTLGRLDAALGDLDRALARVPDAGNRSERAEVLRALGRLQEAVADFDQSIRERDDDAFAYLGRGRAMVALGRPDDALDDFARALDLAPTDATVRFERARLLRQRGDDESALADLRLAEQALRDQLTSAPDDAEALIELAWLYTAGLDERHSEALVLADQAFAALDEAHQRAPYLAARGWALLRLGRHSEALPLLERAAILAPFDDDIRARLIQAMNGR